MQLIKSILIIYFDLFTEIYLEIALINQCVKIVFVMNAR